MDLTPIPDLRVESAGEDVTYHLPTRPLGALRLAGLVPIGFSVFWLAMLAHEFLPEIHWPHGFEYVMGVFLLIFAGAGLIPAGLGLAMLCGRSRIGWRDGRLRVAETVGPFGWPRRMPRGQIRKFVVMGGGSGGANAVPMGSLGGLAALSGQFENGVPRVLVIGYPRPWLEGIAQDLSTRAGISQPAGPPPVEVFEGLAKSLAADVTEKPPGSPVLLQRHDASVQLEIPPAGLRKGSMGLFFFSMVWCGFVALMSVAFVFGKSSTPGQGLSFIPFLAVFWLVGLGMLAGAINLGKRRVTLTAGRSELTVVKTSPFGVKRLQFCPSDMADVSVGTSNVEVNHQHLPELQVHLLTGKKIGFLAGRDTEELKWIATELRNALDMTAPGQSPAALGATVTTIRTRGNPIAGLVALVVLGAICFTVFRHASHSAQSPATKALPRSRPITLEPGVAFSSFGLSRSSKTNAWAVGRQAHAEWFVPMTSGRLTEIQLAIAPPVSGQAAGNATIFVAKDKGGFPGVPLETFLVPAADAAEPVILQSAEQPALESGVKYWLCARSRGGWNWNYNDQNIIQNSAREVKAGAWASAGDYCYIGAFSVRVATNSPAFGN